MAITASISTDGSAEAHAIREASNARVRAVRAKNVDAVLALYHADLVTFDLVEPLANRGKGAVAKRLREWFDSFASDIDYELAHVDIAVHGDVAFDHHFTHVRGRSTSGAEIDMWFRETVGWRKIAGKWLVTHQHSSVPFDMRAMKARLDLRPPSGDRNDAARAGRRPA